MFTPDPQKPRPSRQHQARRPIHVDSRELWREFGAARLRLLHAIVQEGGDTWEAIAKGLSVTEDQLMVLFERSTLTLDAVFMKPRKR